MPTPPAWPVRAVASGLTLAVACAAAGPADALRDFSTSYKGSTRVLLLLPAHAEASLRLQRSARHIVYTMNTTVRLPFVERSFYDCSVLRIEDMRLLPLQYAHLDAGDPALDVRSRFDWTTGQVSTQLGRADKATTQPVQWPTYDPMSLQVALMAAASHRAAGDAEAHQVLERGALKIHRVYFGGLQATPAGALHEVVSRKVGSDKSIVLLLASRPVWQPLRITLEGLTIERVDAGTSFEPAGLADEPAPQCRDEAAPVP